MLAGLGVFLFTSGSYNNKYCSCGCCYFHVYHYYWYSYCYFPTVIMRLTVCSVDFWCVGPRAFGLRVQGLSEFRTYLNRPENGKNWPNTYKGGYCST